MGTFPLHVCWTRCMFRPFFMLMEYKCPFVVAGVVFGRYGWYTVFIHPVCEMYLSGAEKRREREKNTKTCALTIFIGLGYMVHNKNVVLFHVMFVLNNIKLLLLLLLFYFYTYKYKC
jgi:hypothetical protein